MELLFELREVAPQTSDKRQGELNGQAVAAAGKVTLEDHGRARLQGRTEEVLVQKVLESESCEGHPWSLEMVYIMRVVTLNEGTSESFRSASYAIYW